MSWRAEGVIRPSHAKPEFSRLIDNNPWLNCDYARVRLSVLCREREAYNRAKTPSVVGASRRISDGRILRLIKMWLQALGFKYPELFGTVSIIDGTLTDVPAMQSKKPKLYQRIFGGSAERFAAEDPRTLANKNAAAIRGKMAIRLAVGVLVPVNRSFHEQLTKLNIDHDYDVFGVEVGHNPLAIYDSLGEKNWQFYRDALSRAGK